jgi:oxygen-independent coproporphyrinogen-3 oxidase
VPGVYISYPFCTQKCTFCNFASNVSSAEKRRRYADRLLAEISTHPWKWQPETLYFGGGTPSLMPVSELSALIAAVPRSKLSEVTLECAPGTITPELAAHWHSIGINRVSLGVQSFVAPELRQTGRRHTAEVVASDIAALRQAGIENFNIDLIAGLPGQTEASWAESLDWIERIAPPHVSVYIFEIDEDSRLGKEALLGGIRYGAALLPSDDLTATLYEQAVDRLAALAIHRYEISNFARAGFASAHNLKYWRLEPYAGFGLDAHSYDGLRRWSNPDDLDQYLGTFTTPEITATDGAEEHLFVGLRLTDGIEPTAAERARFAEPIARWVDAGLLLDTGAQLRLTSRGMLLSNEILQDFISA